MTVIHPLEDAPEINLNGIQNVKCIDQTTGELFRNGTLHHGEIFKDNPEMQAFYDRVLNNIPRLQPNLSDVVLPSFVWKLNQKELAKYGTHLFANWKQASDGKITTQAMTNEKFPLIVIKENIDKKKMVWRKRNGMYID